MPLAIGSSVHRVIGSLGNLKPEDTSIRKNAATTFKFLRNKVRFAHETLQCNVSDYAGIRALSRVDSTHRNRMRYALDGQHIRGDTVVHAVGFREAHYVFKR